MYLRMFTALDESPVGLLALSYMPALLRIAPVRLIDPDRMGAADLPGRWARYWRALETPMPKGEPFINIVCTRPERWTWVQRIDAAVEDNPDDPEVPTERIEDRLELYTYGARNVLITDIDATAFAKLDDAMRATAIKYQALVRPREVPPPTSGKDHAAFRRIILGE